MRYSVQIAYIDALFQCAGRYDDTVLPSPNACSAAEIVVKDAQGRVYVNAVDVDPLGRLGGGEYFGARELIYVERPA